MPSLSWIGILRRRWRGVVHRVKSGQSIPVGDTILSKYPLDDVRTGLPGDDSDDQARYVEAWVDAGGSAPRRAASWCWRMLDRADYRGDCQCNPRCRWRSSEHHALHCEQSCRRNTQRRIAPLLCKNVEPTDGPADLTVCICRIVRFGVTSVNQGRSDPIVACPINEKRPR